MRPDVGSNPVNVVVFPLMSLDVLDVGAGCGGGDGGDNKHTTSCENECPEMRVPSFVSFNCDATLVMEFLCASSRYL